MAFQTMKIKLKKKDRKRVEAARKIILEHYREHDEIVTAIAKDYGWKFESLEWETLWDHITNDTDWMVEYK